MSNRLVKLFNASPTVHDCEFLEQGLVSYHDIDAGICLLKKETIDSMLPSMDGIPVIIGHQKVTPDNIKKLQNGVVISTYFNADTGKFHAKFIATEPEAQKKIEDGYSVSCAYDTSKMGPGGKWHAIPYHQEILGGKFTHLAIVPADTARYEESFIDTGIKVFQNSLGVASLLKDKPKQEETKMLKFKFHFPIQVEKVENSVDPEKTFVDIGAGKKVSVKQLIEAYNSKSVSAEKIEDVSEDSMLEIQNATGETVKVAIKDLVAAFNASDEDDKKKKEDEDKEKKEIENAMDDKEKEEYGKMDDEKKCAYRNTKKEKRNAIVKQEKEAADKIVLENAQKVKDQEAARIAAQGNIKTFVLINSKGRGSAPETVVGTKHNGTVQAGAEAGNDYFSKGKFAKKK